MLTFHNDPKIKEKYLTRLRAHAAADEIIKGSYWGNGKGCAVGCTVHSSNHEDYENELGIPHLIAKLEDGIFEGLPNEAAKSFPLTFLESVPVGIDLAAEMVFEKFMLWLLIDGECGVYKLASEQGKIAIKEVARLYERKIEGQLVETDEWKSAYAATYASAADYAAAAYASAAAYAAYAAAAYAAAAATYAASAYAAYAYAAAPQNHRIAQAGKLIELLRKSGE
jgi:hypothetical protein